MKFTNGFWLMKDGIMPLYAVEYADHRVDHTAEGDVLTVYASTRHISSRGDRLNIGMLTFRFSSPVENAIRVSVTHFEGTRENGPFPELLREKCSVEIIEEKENLEFRSGNTRAVIDRRPSRWGIYFYDGDRLLTSSSYRNCACMQDRNSGETYMSAQLYLDFDESVYGFGETFTPFVKNGQRIDTWNSDGGTASEQAYKCVPFYLSCKGYGVLVDEEGDVSFEAASEKVEYMQFSRRGESLSYVLFNGGTPKATLERYTAATGRPALPPAWSFGLWLSTSFTTNYDEETVHSFIEGMRKHRIPLEVFHFDCHWMKGYEWCNFEWDPAVFPNPKDMIDRYHKLGLKICVWINPYIAQKSPLFREGAEKNYFIRKANGDIWQTDLWQAGMAIVDFTNKEAADWYCAKLRTLLDMGVDCFKTDFGERIPVRDIVYANGEDPVRMHNYYTYLYNRAVFRLLEEYRGEKEAIVFARSATIGSQQFPVHWGGDCSASYASMAETLRGGLSLACCGFGFWSHDISGFEDTAPADVYKRWCAFGLLSSHSRLHGSSSYRVPWLFDEEACDVLRKFTQLKCTLMPYLYAAAVESHETGVPVMRPMFMEFPDDRACEKLDAQYMLGGSLLVSPVFRENGEAQYYLPEGKWVSLLTGKTVTGGQWKKEIHDFFSLPLLVRPDTLLPMGGINDRTEYDYASETEILLSNFTDGGSASVRIVDCKGNTVAVITAERKAGILHVKEHILSSAEQGGCSSQNTVGFRYRFLDPAENEGVSVVVEKA